MIVTKIILITYAQAYCLVYNDLFRDESMSSIFEKTLLVISHNFVRDILLWHI